MSRHGALSLHLLAPHRHALPAGIALSGLLHAAALGLRPPAPIEPLEPLPLRATSFAVDVVDRHTPPLLTAPLAPRAEPPAPPAPRASAPGIAAPRPAVPLARPSEPTSQEPTRGSPERVAPARAEPKALPVLSASANDPATSAVPASSAGSGSGGPGPAATGTATAASAPPAPATSDGPRAGQARGASRARYLSALSARIRQHRQYPYLARRQGIEGTVCLLVSLDVQGQLLALRVTCGGESEALVEAAKTAVTEAAPFEPLPPDLGTSLAVEVPIVFRLEEG